MNKRNWILMIIAIVASTIFLKINAEWSKSYIREKYRPITELRNQLQEDIKQEVISYCVKEGSTSSYCDCLGQEVKDRVPASAFDELVITDIENLTDQVKANIKITLEKSMVTALIGAKEKCLDNEN